MMTEWGGVFTLPGFRVIARDGFPRTARRRPPLFDRGVSGPTVAPVLPFVTLPDVPLIYGQQAKGVGVPGRTEIAERVWQALEAADEAAAGLPARVAGAVLVALGSGAAEHEELAGELARQFRSHMVYAVEATVHRALLSLGPE
jgi:hypothetical protein